MIEKDDEFVIQGEEKTADEMLSDRLDAIMERIGRLLEGGRPSDEFRRICTASAAMQMCETEAIAIRRLTNMDLDDDRQERAADRLRDAFDDYRGIVREACNRNIAELDVWKEGKDEDGGDA